MSYTPKERRDKHRERMKARGFKRKEYWATDKEHKELKKTLEWMRKHD